MYKYGLTEITFNDGTIINPSNLVVVIGPNNVGKSQILKDIFTKATVEKPPSGIVVSSIKLPLPHSMQEIEDSYGINKKLDTNSKMWYVQTLSPKIDRQINIEYGYSGDGIEAILKSEVSDEQKMPFFIRNFGSSMISFLSTENRLQLLNQSDSPIDEYSRENLLQLFYYSGKEIEQRIRKLTKQVFNRDIFLDFTSLRHLLFRISNDFSNLSQDPREARPILLKHPPLDEQGDGIRSFVGIIVALLCIKRDLFLIDEPEAFLHPPQAFRIGEFIAEQSLKSRQIIISTHSVDVLRGILSKTQDTTILRIDRAGDKNSFHIIDQDFVKSFISDPLLSSARVLDGLFYRGTVVVEADSDAKFYHAAFNKRRRDLDIHFVNADNKQTVSRIMHMYKVMGVRCAGIVDFDVLNNKSEFSQQVDTLNESKVEEALSIRDSIARTVSDLSPDERVKRVQEIVDRLITLVEQAKIQEKDIDKEKILQQIEGRSRDMVESTKPWRIFKEKGASGLSVELRPAFEQLWMLCANEGLFINPCGELEAILVDCGIKYSTDKRAWIIQALQLLPNLQVNEEIYPWKFIN